METRPLGLMSLYINHPSFSPEGDGELAFTLFEIPTDGIQHSCLSCNHTPSTRSVLYHGVFMRNNSSSTGAAKIAVKRVRWLRYESKQKPSSCLQTQSDFTTANFLF